MKVQRITILALFTAAIFTTFSIFPSFLLAENAQIEIVIQVTDEGFFDAEGQSFNNRIQVPKEQKIKLIFENAGKPEEKHAFVLLFDSDEEIESGTIDKKNKRTHIEFTSGETGETYDVFCVLADCDGMEHLTDLLIMTI